MQQVNTDSNLIGGSTLKKETRERTEELLNEEFKLAGLSKCNESYYNGMIQMLEYLGYEWKRVDGKHIIY